MVTQIHMLIELTKFRLATSVFVATIKIEHIVLKLKRNIISIPQNLNWWDKLYH